jgi:hypothetical protein
LAALSGVSCPERTACFAVGSVSDIARNQVTLAERWNGTRWVIQQTPNPSMVSELKAISCSAVTACVAVGDYFYRAGPGRTLVERWNGVRWSIQPSPNRSGAGVSELNGVSCVSKTNCIAAGDSFDSRGVVTLVERWNGSRWSIRQTPNRAGRVQSSLAGVSCASAANCIATGNYFNDAGTGGGPLTERWNGAKWTLQRTPRPADTVFGALRSVSCPSATACTAVGTFTDRPVPRGTALPTKPLAERWNGTRWSIERIPHPVGTDDGALDAVSCPSTTACTAVGISGRFAGGVTLAERWNGTNWTIQPTPTPAGATDSYLFGVSCASKTACAAVGDYFKVSGLAIAERWNGVRWSLQPAG